MPRHQRLISALCLHNPAGLIRDISRDISREGHTSQEDITSEVHTLSAEDLALLFIDSAFALTALQFLVDLDWLEFQKQSGQRRTSYQNLLTAAMAGKLAFINYLLPILYDQPVENLPLISKQILTLRNTCVSIIKLRSPIERKNFAALCLNQILLIFKNEQARANSHGPQDNADLALYHAFDQLDEVLNLHYEKDVEASFNSFQQERTYDGAGVGVQSEYSSVLLALDYLNPKKGSGFLDLGSGYGRVGMIVGLQRPDIRFCGFELIPHRVAVATQATNEMNLQDHVQFKVQNLAAPDFVIPAADIYYLYDPFTDATYERVLEQILRISKLQNISIITKGNARLKFDKIAEASAWPRCHEIDQGNICIYTSKQM